MATSHSWRGLIRSSANLVLGEVVARGLGLCAVVVIARSLDPGGFGLVTLGATLVMWFSLLADSGTELLSIREVARAPEQLRSITDPVLGLRLAFSVVAMVLFSSTVLVLGRYPPDRPVLLAFALVLPMTALNLRWMVLGAGGSKAVAVGNAASQLLFFLVVTTFIRGRHDTLVVPLAQAAGELLYGVVVLVAIGRRFGMPRPRFDFSRWRAILGSSYPLMVNGVARMAVFSFDILLVGATLGRVEAGIYGAASKPVLFFLGGMGLFSTSLLAFLASASPEQIMELFRRTVRGVLLVTVPIAVCLSLGAGTVMSAVYGKAYAAGAPALAILVWWIPVTGLGLAYSNVLIARDRQSLVMWINVGGAVFNVCANLVLVPIAGIRGAALVTVASQAVVVALTYRRAVTLGLAPPFIQAVTRSQGPELVVQP